MKHSVWCVRSGTWASSSQAGDVAVSVESQRIPDRESRPRRFKRLCVCVSLGNTNRQIP